MTSTALQTQMAHHPALAASVSAIRTKLNLTYTEQVYGKALAELVGTSFEPLAGIRVTFLPVIEDHVTQPQGSSNLIFMAQYIEYLTGRRRTLAATVELVDGYVPIGVENQAFEDSLRRSVEGLFNECGYTLEEEAPDGLRKMNSVQLGHALLEYLFMPKTVLASIANIDLDKVEVTVEDGAVVLRTPVAMLQGSSHPSALYLSRSLGGWGPEEFTSAEFNVIRRDALGTLSNLLEGKNLWLEKARLSEGTFGRTFLTDETELTNPYATVVNPDHTETLQLYPDYAVVLSIDETPRNYLICLPLMASGVLDEQGLTVRIPLDLSAPFTSGRVVIECPDDWVELCVRGVITATKTKVAENGYSSDLETVGQTRGKARPAQIIYIEKLQDVVTAAAEKAAERAEEARRAEIRKAVETPSRYSEAIEVEDVVEVPPTPPIHYGLLTRLRVAAQAFTNPGIWKKD